LIFCCSIILTSLIGRDPQVASIPGWRLATTGFFWV
jgi:hypothetical protein